MALWRAEAILLTSCLLALLCCLQRYCRSRYACVRPLGTRPSPKAFSATKHGFGWYAADIPPKVMMTYFKVRVIDLYLSFAHLISVHVVCLCILAELPCRSAGLQIQHSTSLPPTFWH